MHAAERGTVKVARAHGQADIDTVRVLFREYARSLPVDLEYQGFSAELRALPGAYAPPSGALLIARSAAAAIGCIAVRPIDARTCEMKRLYVRPAHRGTGAGGLLVDAAVSAARACGYQEMWLDTLPGMTDAHALYLRRGFREIAPYGGPAAPGTRYLGLRL